METTTSTELKNTSNNLRHEHLSVNLTCEKPGCHDKCLWSGVRQINIICILFYKQKASPLRLWWRKEVNGSVSLSPPAFVDCVGNQERTTVFCIGGRWQQKHQGHEPRRMFSPDAVGPPGHATWCVQRIWKDLGFFFLKTRYGNGWKKKKKNRHGSFGRPGQEGCLRWGVQDQHGQPGQTLRKWGWEILFTDCIPHHPQLMFIRYIQSTGQYYRLKTAWWT